MQKILRIAPLPDESGYKHSISVFIALLFHINGVLGMAGNEKKWFIAMTPVNLLVMFVLLIYTDYTSRGNREGAFRSHQIWANYKNLFVFCSLCFVVGMLVEIIGVNTGLLFGRYFYGEPMGIKLLGVPLLIGIQWFVSVYCSVHIFFGLKKMLNILPSSDFINASCMALITTAFDYIIEPAAVKLGFWSWYGQDVPLYNYVCWFVISFFLSLFYVKKRLDSGKVNYFAIVLFFIQMLFFIYVTLFL